MSLLVVGVAASAGGLEALTILLKSLPAHNKICVIVAQHLSPDHDSMLTKLLSRESHLVVETARNGSELVGGKVFVIPPGFNALVQDANISLTPTTQQGVPKPSANELFISLAEQLSERAVGVVLSGTGSDGARGCREIKAHGGFTFAQIPEQSKYDGMPLAAIETACIDRILAVEDIANELVRLADTKELSPNYLKKPVHSDCLNRIMQLVLRSTGVDFSNYKDNTLHRRIGRRLTATNTSSWIEYEEYLRENPDEIQKLFQDLLISVTSFFRDKDSFKELQQTVQQIVNTKKKGDEIRVWVAGCATGEEAYSIAMLFHDILDGQLFDYRLQIFATDIDLKALAIARKGIYDSATLKGFNNDLKVRYFTRANDGYQITKNLRETVVFAKQNLVGDPAFLRLDLVSCRNVLIYMKSDLQKQVLATFHYGLNSRGYLFLGKSESLPGSDFFEAKSPDSKLFIRKGDKRTHLYRRYKVNPRIIDSNSEIQKTDLANMESLDAKIVRSVSRFICQKAFVVDDIMDIRFVYGDLSEITQIGKGRTSLNLQNMIHPDLQLEIKGLIFKAKKESGSQRSRTIPFRSSYLCFEVLPLIEYLDKNRLFLVRYEISSQAPAEVSLETQGDQNSKLLQLQHELFAMREHLQTVIEELETSNEELQAVNEEMQSANEELQSTNEELETSNEELQSTNEELTTVNEELHVKSVEIQSLNSDLQNLQMSLPHPLLVLDKEMRLVHFNEAAKKIAEISELHFGEYIENLPHLLHLPDIRFLVNKAAQHGQTVNQQIKGNVRDYLLSVTSYKHTKGYGNGAILLFWDNTELLSLYQSLQQAISENNLQARVIEAAEQGIIIVDALKNDMPIIYTNSAFVEMTGYTHEEIFGQNCRFLQGPETDPVVVNSIRDSIKNKNRHRCLLKNYRKDGKVFWNQLSIAPVFDGDTVSHYIGIQNDVTDVVISQNEALIAQTIFGATTDKIAIFNLKQQLTYANHALKDVLPIVYNSISDFNYTTLFDLDNNLNSDNGWSNICRAGNWEGELIFTGSGSRVPHYVSVTKLTDPKDGEHNLVIIAKDIEALKDRENQLNKMALYDELTGLANRRYLSSYLQDVVARHHRTNTKFALLFLDLDNFKKINDSFGHHAGDLVLKYFANLLKELIRDSDFFARISGDEFVILLDDISTPRQAQQFSSRIFDSLSRPCDVDRQIIFLSTSIGIAIYPDDGNEADLVLRNADIAMYKAKQKGNNQYQFVNVHESEELRQQLILEGELKRALIQNENIGLYLLFQPYYKNMLKPEISGVEALIRCQHSKLGALTADNILKAVKSANLEELFDVWVVKNILSCHKKWIEHNVNVENFRVSVNLHAKNLQKISSEKDNLFRILNSKEKLSWLTIEITEDALIGNSDTVRASLHVLENLGINVAIDDFGVGYSNFLYLTELSSINVVKIDKLLLRGIEENITKRDKIVALVQMLKKFGFETVAEGVETINSMEAISHMDVDVIQGYYLSKPITEEELLFMIKL